MTWLWHEWRSEGAHGLLTEVSFPIKLPVAVPMVVGSKYCYSSLTLPVGEAPTSFSNGLPSLVLTAGSAAVVLGRPQCMGRNLRGLGAEKEGLVVAVDRW